MIDRAFKLVQQKIAFLEGRAPRVPKPEKQNMGTLAELVPPTATSISQDLSKRWGLLDSLG